MSTHNLCFGSNIRRIGIPGYIQNLLFKNGSKGYTFHGHVFLMAAPSSELQSHKWGMLSGKLSLPVDSRVSFASNTQSEKVQVGKDQEKAQSEKDSHSKNRGGKKPN